MKKNQKYILVLLLAFNISFAQVKGIYDEYLKLPEHFKKTESNTNTFEWKMEPGIISLQLKPDSTFIYYSIFAHSFYETIGKYNMQNNIVCLNWDSSGSLKLRADTTSIYKKYFANRQPTILKINNVKYKLNDEKGKLTKQSLIQHGGTDLFISSKDVYSNPFRIYDDSVLQRDFNQNENKMTITMKSKKQIVYKPDTIWGDRDFFAPDGVYGRLHRHGLHVVYMNEMVIYSQASSDGHGGFTYFSKTMDSEIFSLNRCNLKKCYGDNPKFLKLLKRNVNLTKYYLDYDTYKRTYKIVNLYKESIK